MFRAVYPPVSNAKTFIPPLGYVVQRICFDSSLSEDSEQWHPIHAYAKTLYGYPGRGGHAGPGESPVHPPMKDCDDLTVPAERLC